MNNHLLACGPLRLDPPSSSSSCPISSSPPVFPYARGGCFFWSFAIHHRHDQQVVLLLLSSCAPQPRATNTRGGVTDTSAAQGTRPPCLTGHPRTHRFFLRVQTTRELKNDLGLIPNVFTPRNFGIVCWLRLLSFGPVVWIFLGVGITVPPHSTSLTLNDDLSLHTHGAFPCNAWLQSSIHRANETGRRNRGCRCLFTSCARRDGDFFFLPPPGSRAASKQASKGACDSGWRIRGREGYRARPGCGESREISRRFDDTLTTYTQYTYDKI